MGGRNFTCYHDERPCVRWDNFRLQLSPKADNRSITYQSSSIKEGDISTGQHYDSKHRRTPTPTHKIYLVYRCLNSLASPLRQEIFVLRSTSHRTHATTRGQVNLSLRLPYASLNHFFSGDCQMEPASI